MNYFIGIICSLIIASILLYLFYLYLNKVRDIYVDYDSGDIEKLPWYAPKRWVKDAWNPTFAAIQRNLIILKTKL